MSKEIRSLDNTISMYNLVDVCLFCSQYFDPDFPPDGIAYPVRASSAEVRSAPHWDTVLLIFARYSVL